MPHEPHAAFAAACGELRERRAQVHARAAELEATRERLDAIDLELIGLQRIRAAETRDRLARRGFDVSGYTLPPYPRPVERRSGRRSTMVEADTATRATAPRNDEGRTLRHYVGGYVIRVV